MKEVEKKSVIRPGYEFFYNSVFQKACTVRVLFSTLMRTELDIDVRILLSPADLHAEICLISFEESLYGTVPLMITMYGKKSPFSKYA